MRHDQPAARPADQQRGEDKQTKPVQGIRQHPKIRGTSAKTTAAAAAATAPAGVEPLSGQGLVGADDEVAQPQVPAHHRSDEAEIDVVVRRFDRADRCRHRGDPMADPRASPRATLAELEALANQAVDEPDDRVACATARYLAERGQRDQRYTMRGTGVRDDRTCSDAQRSVSDADGHIPALAEQARTREVDGLDTPTHVRQRGVGPDGTRHGPRRSRGPRAAPAGLQPALRRPP